MPVITQFLPQAELNPLENAISNNPTNGPTSPAVVVPNAPPAVSPNSADNPTPNAPSTTAAIYANGLAASSNTALQKSNASLAHACDSSTYAGMMAYQIGAFGGQIVQAIRNAIKAIMAYFGVNPSSSGLVSQLKKIAQYIKDTTKFIKDITDAINGFITYVNAIKQLLAYILSLPSVLLGYFKDCIATLKKQLVAGFQSALDNTPNPTDDQVNELQNTIKDVQNSIKQFTASVGTLVTTASQAALSLVTPGQIAVANTQQQAAATQAVFSAAGFSGNSGIQKP